ncbi:interleukin-1 receptor-like 1 isoform X3 [Podarcis muralis]
MALLYFIFLMAFSATAGKPQYWLTIAGEAFVVKCPVHDTAVWKRGDTTISTDKRARIHASGNELWFLPASIEDNGNYTCIHPEYAPKTMSVIINPNIEGTCYYEDALYLETTGSPRSAKIFCPSYNDYENASDMKWFKDCKLLHGARYKAVKNILYISDAIKSDSGYYTCQFTYHHGGRAFPVTATTPFTITDSFLLTSPKVLYPKDGDVIEVEIGSPAQLLCKAWLGHGKQDIAISFWEFDEANDSKRFVTSNKSYMVPGEGQFAEAELSITEVREEDLSLTFRCVLANDLEFETTEVTLVPKGAGEGLTMILVMVYHVFRVDIVLCVRRTFNCNKSRDDGKVHDAYVIYPTNDTYENNFMGSFVHQILPEVLEKQCGYRLCIYGRDVLPGEDAISATESRIQKSRRLIILLTEWLAKREHFAYEHQIAFYNVLIQSNVKVILLEMEEIGDYERLQESLRHLIHQQGTIKWRAKYMASPSSPNTAFWKHVEYQMPWRRRSKKPTTANPAYGLL